MRRHKSTTDKLNQLRRVGSYLTKEQYFTQFYKIMNESKNKKK